MSDFFPSNKAQALTMLYLQNRDLIGLTPEQYVEEYYHVLGRIIKQIRDTETASYNPVSGSI